MNEIQFLHKNRKKWEEFDRLLAQNRVAAPDQLYDLYIKLTDDLAYARTYFPGSEAEGYINELARKAHLSIYRNKKTDFGHIFRFWTQEFPLLVYASRRAVCTSFLIMAVATLIGLLSYSRDPRFAHIILGDSYVNMTQSNIKQGDPMAVYKSMNETEMFLGITLNNIKVSFIAFVMGIFTAFGTGYILLRNGVMLGTFHAFFASHGLLTESLATIWIHGTFEIFSIIVAGAAGITLGNSFLFPKTLSRIRSFQKGSRQGAQLIVGLIPFFIVAGFLEGFVTRHTELSYGVRFGLSGASLMFIIFYFYHYPKKLIKSLPHE